MRYKLDNGERSIIQPMLPDEPRVSDRRDQEWAGISRASEVPMESEPALYLFVFAHRLARKPRTLFGPMPPELGRFLGAVDEGGGLIFVNRKLHR